LIQIEITITQEQRFQLHLQENMQLITFNYNCSLSNSDGHLRRFYLRAEAWHWRQSQK